MTGVIIILVWNSNDNQYKYRMLKRENEQDSECPLFTVHHPLSEVEYLVPVFTL